MWDIRPTPTHANGWLTPWRRRPVAGTPFEWGTRHEAVERGGGRLVLRTRFRWHKAGNAVIDDQLSIVFS
jgi:hypothetical protein